MSNSVALVKTRSGPSTIDGGCDIRKFFQANSFILRGFRFSPYYSGVPDISGVEVLVGHDASFPDRS
jgi:hypothetical protein